MGYASTTTFLRATKKPNYYSTRSSTQGCIEIVNFKLNLDPDYFKSKHWASKTPSAYQLGLIRAEMYRKSLSSRQGLPLQDFEDTVEDRERETAVAVGFLDEDGGEWDEYFNRHPHSNERTRNLLPAAIEATNLAIKSDLNDWRHPSEFPPAVLEWFKGQKESLFLLRECVVSKRHGDRIRKLRRHSAN